MVSETFYGNKSAIVILRGSHGAIRLGKQLSPAVAEVAKSAWHHARTSMPDLTIAAAAALSGQAQGHAAGAPPEGLHAVMLL
jgi:hypothetical protein